MIQVRADDKGKPFNKLVLIGISGESTAIQQVKGLSPNTHNR